MLMPNLYHVLSLREPVFIRPAELGGIQQVFFINNHAGRFQLGYFIYIYRTERGEGEVQNSIQI